MLPRHFAALLLAALTCTAAYAAEDSAAFLDALRDRGHLDLAIDYINRLSQDASTPPAVTHRLGYERAVTLLEQSQKLTSPQARKAAVASARADLESFIEQGDPQLAAAASMKLAGALASSAARDAALAKKEAGPTAKQLSEEARSQFDQARTLYARSESLFEQALAPLKSAQPASPAAKQRLQLRFQLAQARLSGTRALMAKAQTYPSDARKFKSLMNEAGEAFAELYEKYDTAQSAGIGFYAHLYEGQCYLAVDKLRQAENCFELLTTLPAEEASLRTLITLGHAYRTVSLARQQKHEVGIEAAQRWLAELNRAEQNQPHALTLLYQLGEATRQLAEQQTGSDQQKLLRTARNYFQDAARGFGEHQADARIKLAELNEVLGGETLAAQTFDEAYQIGISALLAARVAGDEAPTNKPQALQAFRLALRLATPETPSERINDARLKLAFLFYEEQSLLQAAALAEFVATKYADDPSAKDAARLAMAALDQLRRDSHNDSFASRELSRVAEFATRRWQADPLADAAFGVLVSTAIREDRLQDARAVLKDVSPDRRASLELKLAIAIWEQARAGSPDAQSQALETLRTAVQKGAKPSDATSATAALLLAQAELAQGDAAAALTALEQPQYGPLTLVARNDPAVNRAGFSAETYRSALQAYLSTSPPRTNDAMQMMGQLEQASSDKASLTRTYVALGVQLQRQIESLNQAGKQAEAERVGQAFAELITRIGDTGGELDWTMQQWLAQTHLKLGQQFTGPERTKFLTRARDGLQKLLDLATRDPASAPSPNSVLAVRMQIAGAQASLGEHSQAVDAFAELLGQRQMMLDVQKSAAMALEQWGQAEDAQHLTEAIRGTRPGADGKNVIWGWSKLAQVAGRAARSQPKYRDLYFEAWLHVASCRYLAGEKATGTAQAKQFASARQTILLLSRQYPQLGGEQRRNEFDTLLKKIQTAEGQRAVGLLEISNN